MRNKPARWFGALAMAGATLAASLALASPALAKTDIYDTGVNLGKGSTVISTCDFDQATVMSDGAKAIKKWRQDALNDTNVKIVGEKKTIAAYLEEKGIPKEQYLNPKPSALIENIAIQRAVEMRSAGELSHTRPNGEPCFTASVGSIPSSNEIIAWGTHDIASTVDLWASEKADFIRIGQDTPETGHYWALINPNNKSFGFAGTGSYWSGEFQQMENPGSMLEGSDEGLETASDTTNLKGTYKVKFNMPSEDVAKNATINQTSVGVGKSVELGATYKGMPIEAKDWQSSDAGVVTVNGSKATGVKQGKAKLTLHTSDGTAIPFELLSGAQYMYRLYNPYTGEHFYTASASERDGLVEVGWNDEGTGWTAPEAGEPVYRLYNSYAPGGDHHYTTSAEERDGLIKVGWTDEGIGWATAGEDGVPLYRQYNPYAATGTHNYTTSKEENDGLVSLGWRAEGISWYGVDISAAA